MLDCYFVHSDYSECELLGEQFIVDNEQLISETLAA